MTTGDFLAAAACIIAFLVWRHLFTAKKIAYLNNRLRKQTSDLEMAHRELEVLIYSVSHDLRTPLRAIEGFSRELLENGAGRLGARGQDDLRRIGASTQRMGALIEDLLELSRLSRQPIQRTEVDLSAMVGSILDALQKLEPGRRVDWKIQGQVSIYGDAHLLRVALDNLLQNSWKFTQPVSAPRIEFGTTTHAESPAYYVRDNGVGFNAEYADKLFKPFQRLHDAQEFPGRGIGLALVQRIVQRHGGKIWTESREGEGAVFYFTLPQRLPAMTQKGVPDEYERRHTG